MHTFFYVKFVNFEHVTCFIANLIPIWPRSLGLRAHFLTWLTKESSLLNTLPDDITACRFDILPQSNVLRRQ